MLGYGLLNSKIQEFCLSGIINSFLNRSTIYLYPIYLNYESATDKDKENIINSLYNIFIQEELRLSPRLFNTFQDFKNWEQKVEPKSTTLYYIDETTQNIVEVNYDENGLFTNNLIADKNYNNYPDLILKYILSSNVVSDKDYEFSKKLPNEIIEDGKNNLNKLFRKVFDQFYYSPYFSENSSDTKDFNNLSFKDFVEFLLFPTMKKKPNSVEEYLSDPLAKAVAEGIYKDYLKNPDPWKNGISRIKINVIPKIKQYIKDSQDYGSYTITKENIKLYDDEKTTLKNITITKENIKLYDDEKTTLKNISTYIEKYNGYVDNLYKIINFYKNKKLLEDRDYYLKLLNGQINSLQTTKVDGNEKYLTLEG
jgi:hypothetical protein